MCLRCYLADMERRGVLLTRSLALVLTQMEGGRGVGIPAKYATACLTAITLHTARDKSQVVAFKVAF